MANTDFNNFNAAEDEPNPVNIIKPVAGNVGLLPRPMSEVDHDYYQILLHVSLTSGSGTGTGATPPAIRRFAPPRSSEPVLASFTAPTPTY